MNSLIQTLYHNTEFRAGVFKWNVSDGGEQEKVFEQAQTKTKRFGYKLFFFSLQSTKTLVTRLKGPRGQRELSTTIAIRKIANGQTQTRHSYELRQGAQDRHWRTTRRARVRPRPRRFFWASQNVSRTNFSLVDFTNFW